MGTDLSFSRNIVSSLAKKPIGYIQPTTQQGATPLRKEKAQWQIEKKAKTGTPVELHSRRA
jgi:hypothetical protein